MPEDLTESGSATRASIERGSLSRRTGALRQGKHRRARMEYRTDEQYRWRQARRKAVKDLIEFQSSQQQIKK